MRIKLGSKVAEHCLAEHQGLKQRLAALTASSVSDPNFDGCCRSSCRCDSVVFECRAVAAPAVARFRLPRSMPQQLRATASCTDSIGPVATLER
jgi:hypothetical protein